MGAENQHIASVKGYSEPLMSLFPGRVDTPAVNAWYVHFVATGDYLEASILYSRWVNGEVGSDMLDAADVIVCRSVQVCLEAVAVGLLVVYFVFEQEHILTN